MDQVSAGGGRYDADQNPDGTWNVRRVPVFLDHEIPLLDKATGQPVLDEHGQPARYRVDRAWLVGALAANQQRAAEGYLAPVHLEHHYDRRGQRQPTRRAGALRLREVAPITYDGEQHEALYADLVSLDAEAYAEIKAGRLPYLSAEVLNLARQEIDSVALMDDDAPFWRLPNITVGHERPHPSAAAAAPSPAPTYRFAPAGPVLAYSARGSGGHALLVDLRSTASYDASQQEPPMPEPVAPAAAPKIPREVGEALMRHFEGAMATLRQYMGDAPPAQPEQPAPVAMADAGAPAADDEVIEPAEQEHEQEPAAAQMWDPGVPAGRAPAQRQAAGAGPALARPGKRPALPAAYSALQQEVAAARGELAALKAERTKAQLVARALTDLAPYGLTDEQTRADVLRYAADGPAALSAYVAAVKRHCTVDPPTSADELDPATAGNGDADLTPYLDHPGERALALALSQEYDARAAAGVGITLDRKRYISMGVADERARAARAGSPLNGGAHRG